MEALKKKTNPEGMNTHWKAILAVTAILFLTAEVVLLMLQNRDLKRQLSAKAPEMLKGGDEVPSLRAVSMAGDTMNVTYDDGTKRYLLLVFSTTCPHCEKTLPRWKEIVDEMQDDDCDILGVSTSNLEATRKYIVEKGIDFNVVTTDTSFWRKYKVNGVPATILIKEKGKVENVWFGELSEANREEIITLARTKRASINPLNQ
jgi:peroxiredoxin